MSLNLLDAAKGLFTNELVNKASSFLGESENGVSKALSGIVPTLLNGLLNKTSTHEGQSILTRLAEEQHASGIAGNLSSFFSSNNETVTQKGTGLLNGLFGDKLSMATNLISNFSGIKSSSATSLLSMALPAILALIGKRMSAGGSSIASLLSTEKNNIAAAVPAGLSLKNLFSSVDDNVIHTSTQPKAVTSNYPTPEKGNSMRLLLPLLLLVGLGLVIWYLLGKGCSGTDATVAATTDSIKNNISEVVADAKQKVAETKGKLDSLTGDWFYDAGETATIDLPNGAGQLSVGKNSTEYRLVNFLNDNTAVLDTVKGNWFEFTNVHFKKGGSDLTDESMAQLKNMMLIAKAYPNAKFKFGGYTDNTGTDAINIPLSQKRADAVINMIVKLGASKDAIAGAKGYGSEWPIATNETTEGRAQNRRVAVNVKSK